MPNKAIDGFELRRLRITKGFSTGNALARASGVSAKQIQNLESGKTATATERTITRIAKALLVEPEAFLLKVRHSVEPVSQFLPPIRPDIQAFLDRKQVALAVFDEYVQLQHSPGWRGWSRNSVSVNKNIPPFRSQILTSLMKLYPVPRGEPRNDYYSLRGWKYEAKHEDEIKVGQEIELQLTLEGGSWNHIFALNGRWKDYNQNPPDPDAVNFRREFEDDILAICNGSSRLYHNMNAEVILVTSDNKVVITRRPRRSVFSEARWTASLEEQLMRRKHGSATSDNADIFECAERGARDELGITPISEKSRLLSFGIEWGNFTAAFLVLIRCTETFAELLKAWPMAPENTEATVVDCLEVVKIPEAIKRDHWLPSQRAAVAPKTNEPCERGLWHPVARARLDALMRHLDSTI